MHVGRQYDVAAGYWSGRRYHVGIRFENQLQVRNVLVRAPNWDGFALWTDIGSVGTGSKVQEPGGSSTNVRVARSVNNPIDSSIALGSSITWFHLELHQVIDVRQDQPAMAPVARA
jgi:hypothetical protein